MSLASLAQRIGTDKGRDQAAGAAPSAPAPAGPAASVSPEATAPDAGELEAAVAEAKAQMARAADSKAMRRDPYQHILTGLALTLEALPRTVRRWEQAVQDVIAARHPLTPEERADLASALVEASQDGAYQGMRKEAARMIRRLDRGLAVRVGLCVGCAFVLGSVLTAGALAAFSAGPFRPELEAGAAWRDLVQSNPDPRPALAGADVRTDRATGRRYYAGVSLWLDPPRPPPAAAAKPPGNQ